MMNIAQLQNFFMEFLPLDHTMILVANHGVGKSEVIKYNLRKLVAEKHSVPPEEVGFIERRGAQLDPSDLIGGIFMVGGRTYNAPPSWLPVHPDSAKALSKPLKENGMEWTEFESHQYGILFLDEYNRANPLTRQALFELILDRSLHGVKIPDTWYVIGAINGDTNLYSVDEMEPAEMDRVVLIRFEPSYDELFLYQNREIAKGVLHEAVLAYCRMFGDRIDPSPEVIEVARSKGEKTYSRRSWVRLGKALKKSEERGLMLTERVNTPTGYAAVRSAAEGYVGLAEAASFTQFVKEQYDVLTPDAILNKLDDAVKQRIVDMAESNVPALSGLSDALVGHLIQKVGDKSLSSRQEENITVFLECVPREVVAGFWMHWSRVNNSQARRWHSTVRRHNITTRSICPGHAYDQWVKDMRSEGYHDLTADTRVV